MRPITKIAGYQFNGYYIPPRMAEGLENWLTHGILPGHFLTAVLMNDLTEAVGRADAENLANLPAYIAYLYNETPASCWGSPEKVLAWQQRFVTKEPE